MKKFTPRGYFIIFMAMTLNTMPLSVTGLSAKPLAGVNAMSFQHEALAVAAQPFKPLIWNYSFHHELNEEARSPRLKPALIEMIRDPRFLIPTFWPVPSLAGGSTNEGWGKTVIWVNGKDIDISLSNPTTIGKILSALEIKNGLVTQIRVTPKNARPGTVYPQHIVPKVLSIPISLSENNVSIETGEKMDVAGPLTLIRDMQKALNPPDWGLITSLLEKMMTMRSIFRSVATQTQFSDMELALKRLTTGQTLNNAQAGALQTAIADVSEQVIKRIQSFDPSSSLSLEDRLLCLPQGARRIIHKTVHNINIPRMTTIADWNAFIARTWDEPLQKINPEIRSAIRIYMETFMSKKSTFGEDDTLDIRMIHGRATRYEIARLMKSIDAAFEEIETIAREVMDPEKRARLAAGGDKAAALERVGATARDLASKDARIMRRLSTDSILSEIQDLMVRQINEWWTQGFAPNDRWMERYQEAFFQKLLNQKRIIPDIPGFLMKTKIKTSFIRRSETYLGPLYSTTKAFQAGRYSIFQQAKSLSWSIVRAEMPSAYLSAMYLYGSWKSAVETVFKPHDYARADLGPTVAEAHSSFFERLFKLETELLRLRSSGPNSRHTDKSA